MANDKQRDALLVIGKHLKSEIDRAPLPEAKPDIERALRRLLERDVAERSRPQTRWAGRSEEVGAASVERHRPDMMRKWWACAVALAYFLRHPACPISRQAPATALRLGHARRPVLPP